MRPALILVLLLGPLGACGVDGPPRPPAKPQGVNISGEARIGVVAKL